jgi:hypothetical protein
MHFALALLLSTVVPPQSSSQPNLDFRTGRLSGWEGQGFYITTGAGEGPSLTAGVSSSDRGKKGRTGLLYRTLRVPAGAGAIRFSAAAVHPKGVEPGARIDVYLEVAGQRLIPKQVHTAKGWEKTDELLPLQLGRTCEYQWWVSDLVGQSVRIVLLDEDDRPGCHVSCSGFQVVPLDDVNGREFAAVMNRLTKQGSLSQATRYETKHFMVFSTASDLYTEHRLYNCETVYGLFFNHFRRRGISVREPPGKMMVAVFDTQTGLEAYLGYQLPSVVTGMYHPVSNRLLVYDYGTNRAFVAGKNQAQEFARQIKSDIHRQRIIGTFSRQAQDWRDDANIGTIMHEVAHQLSFNSGMINREGDAPVWLAEGLACYCEATDNGAWQGVGETNSLRANTLAVVLRDKGKFIPLPTLVGSDDWYLKATNANVAMLGYSQSWALFHMLMETRPQALRNYLALIYPRRTPDHRLEDFAQAFGSPDKLEREYQAYMKALAQTQARVQK